MRSTWVLRTEYNKCHRRAQLMTKVSCVLSVATLLLTAAVIHLDQRNYRTELQYAQAIESLELELALQAHENECQATPKAIEPEVELNPDTAEEQIYLGEYTITYYCPCYECSEGWEDNTATGVTATEGVTVAVDPEVIPYGTELYIEGIGNRIAQDCGGLIQGNRIDVYMNSHEEATQNGIHKAEVYITGGTANEQK